MWWFLSRRCILFPFLVSEFLGSSPCSYFIFKLDLWVLTYVVVFWFLVFFVPLVFWLPLCFVLCRNWICVFLLFYRWLGLRMRMVHRILLIWLKILIGDLVQIQNWKAPLRLVFSFLFPHLLQFSRCNFDGLLLILSWWVTSCLCFLKRIGKYSTGIGTNMARYKAWTY